MEHWDMPILKEFLEATPSAELLPLSAGIQSDEEEMGLTYKELSDFGYVRTERLAGTPRRSSKLTMDSILRKVHKLGPWSCYLRLLSEWKHRPGFGPREIADKVFKFFRF